MYVCIYIYIYIYTHIVKALRLKAPSTSRRTSRRRPTKGRSRIRSRVVRWQSVLSFGVSRATKSTHAGPGYGGGGRLRVTAAAEWQRCGLSDSSRTHR